MAIWWPATGMGRSKEEAMREFKEIFIDAAPPYERGVQYGQLAREEIHLCIERYREHFKAADDGVVNKDNTFIPHNRF